MSKLLWHAIPRCLIANVVPVVESFLHQLKGNFLILESGKKNLSNSRVK